MCVTICDLSVVVGFAKVCPSKNITLAFCKKAKKEQKLHTKNLEAETNDLK